MVIFFFVIVCRMAKIVAGSSNLIPFSAFFLFQHDLLFNRCTSWQYCRIYGLDLPILHPGRQPARRGEAPLRCM